MKYLQTVVVLVPSAACVFAGKVEDYGDKIAPLIDPAKLATPGTRVGNPRVQKYVHWLATAEGLGEKAQGRWVVGLIGISYSNQMRRLKWMR